jgi:preprotein translocase subunit SecB
MADMQEPIFMIERIYVKDLSFESPNAPQSFTMSEAPSVDVGLNTETHEVPGVSDLVEVVLTVTVNAKSADSTYFAVEVQQGGLFRMQNIPEEHQPVLLAVHCPTILFPYAREAVAELVGRGGFQPLHLHPVNFEALYQQAQLEQSQHTTQ